MASHRIQVWRAIRVRLSKITLPIISRLDTSSHKKPRRVQESGPALLAVLLVGLGSVTLPQFRTTFNINSVISSATPIALLAIGMTVVLLAAEIDLSVGSVMSLASVMLATLMGGKNSNMIPTIAVTLVVCTFVGLINGILTVLVRIPSFITTLAMLFIIDGINLVWTNGSPPSGLAPKFTNLALAGKGILTTGLLVTVAAAYLSVIFLNRTLTGKTLYLIGSNSRSANNSGLPVKLVIFRAFMISGLCAGLAGIYATSYTGSGETFLGTGMELTAIAAAVIGGVNLFGGKGTALNAIFGAFILAVIFDILLLVGAPSEVQPIVTGVVLVVGVVFYSRSRGSRAWIQKMLRLGINKNIKTHSKEPGTDRPKSETV